MRQNLEALGWAAARLDTRPEVFHPTGDSTSDPGEELTLTFASVPAFPSFVEVARSARTVEVGGATGPGGVLMISFDRPGPDWKTLAPTEHATAPETFRRIYLSRPAAIPASTGRSYVVRFYKSDRPPAPGSIDGRNAAGDASFAVTKNGKTDGTGATVKNLAVLVCPARVGRTSVEVTNEDGPDIYVGPTSGVTAGTGRLVPAGRSVTLYTTADVFAIEPTNVGSDVTATEVYT